MNIKDIDYGSLDFWDKQNEFSFHDAVCLWLNYKPEDGSHYNRKYPHDLKMAFAYILDFANKGELLVWPCHEYERHLYRELYKKDGFPFNPDEPAPFKDGALDIDKAFKKKGVLSDLEYRLSKTFLWGTSDKDEMNAEFAEAERYYDGLAVWRKDLIRIAEKTNHKPLFLYPELRAGKTLKEIWPKSPTIGVPEENKEKTELPSPKKLLTRKPTSKKKKKRSKPKNTYKLKPPASPKKASPDPDTGKGRIQSLRRKVEGITRSAVRGKPAVTTPEVYGLSELKVAMSEYSKKGTQVADKTIQNWIRDELRKQRGGRLDRGRPAKRGRTW